MNETKTRKFKEKMVFLFKELFPKLFYKNTKYITMINIVSASAQQIMSVFIIKYILDMAMEKNSDVNSIVLTSFIYTAIFILFGVLNNIMIVKSDFIFICDRIYFLGNMIKKVTMMDYEIYENPKEMLKVEQSFNGIGSDNFGYNFVLKTLFSLLPNLLTGIVFSLILLRRSIVIVIVIILSLIFNFIFSTKLSNFINKNRDNVDKESRKLGAYTRVTKDFTYGKDIRVYKLKDSLIRNINKFIGEYVKAKSREFKFKFKISFLENFTLSFSDLISFLLLAYLTVKGIITSSELVMLFSLTVLFANNINKIKDHASKIYTQIPYIMDTYEFYWSDLYINKNGKYKKFEGPVSIRFENVSYKYPGTEKYVFENLNFNIEAGKRVALVGVNGAGKTTIVKLMTALAKPTSGNIFINNINMKELSDKAIFDLYSVVFQETEPLAFSIAENISCVENNIDFNKVEYTLKKVGLWDKISKLDNSYNSNMLKVIYDDGVILSGGENQKLMIARALYKEKTSVMIMDEPTAALDAFAEEKIYQEFDSYMDNKTAVFISHRLASTKFCDEIMFLDGGKIIAKGRHEELIENCKEYKDMFETQGKYYKENGNE